MCQLSLAVDYQQAVSLKYYSKILIITVGGVVDEE